jgi:hypothetical protein
MAIMPQINPELLAKARRNKINQVRVIEKASLCRLQEECNSNEAKTESKISKKKLNFLKSSFLGDNNGSSIEAIIEIVEIKDSKMSFQ